MEVLGAEQMRKKYLFRLGLHPCQEYSRSSCREFTFSEHNCTKLCGSSGVCLGRKLHYFLTTMSVLHSECDCDIKQKRGSERMPHFSRIDCIKGDLNETPLGPVAWAKDVHLEYAHIFL